MGRTYFSNARFAVCGQFPPQPDGMPGGGGILFWHTEYGDALDDERDINERGGFAYTVFSPGGEIDPYDDQSSYTEAVMKRDERNLCARVKPWFQLNIHKVKTAADILAVVQVTLNSYGLPDSTYNKICTILGSQHSFYTSDLISVAKRYATDPEALEYGYQEYLKRRKDKFIIRQFWKLVALS
jgi:hypothetical protein